MTNPITKDRRHFEDLAEGESFALGPRTLTKPDIVAFAREFDPFPFHLDEKAAKSSLLGGLSASGWQTGALTLRMLVESALGDFAAMGGLGFEKLKWRRPVMVDDTISGTATITGLRRSQSRPEMGIVTMGIVMRNQTGKEVMTMSLAVMVETRTPHAAPAEAVS